MTEDMDTQARLKRAEEMYSRQTQETYRVWEMGMGWRDRAKRAEKQCEILHHEMDLLKQWCYEGGDPYKFPHTETPTAKDMQEAKEVAQKHAK